jgi:large subunit ribosomal protein L10
MSVDTREKKGQVIDGLQDEMTKCQVGILTDYRGLGNQEMTALRRRLQEASIDYKVVKNTMARFAAERMGRDDLAGSFEGPVAIALGYDDIVAPARVLVAFIREAETELSIKGGFLADRLLTTEEVMTLATLPPREILLAKLLGQLQVPVSSLLNTLSSPLRGFIGILQARIKQLEEE